MRFSALIFLVMSGCMHVQTIDRPAPQTAMVNENRAQEVDEVSLKDLIKKKQNEKPNPSDFLVSFLIDAKVPYRRNRVGQGRVWEVRDLTCRVAMEAMGQNLNANTLCEGVAVIGQFPRLKYQSFRYKGERAEELRMWLFSWPLRQGDPGVTASWLNCGEIGEGSRNCDLAFDLGYQGP